MSRLSEKEGRFKIGQIYSKLNSMLLCLTRYQSGTRTGYLSFYDPEVRTQSQLSATLSEGTDTVACSVLCTKYLCVVLYSQGISLHFTSYVQYRFLSQNGQSDISIVPIPTGSTQHPTLELSCRCATAVFHCYISILL